MAKIGPIKVQLDFDPIPEETFQRLEKLVSEHTGKWTDTGRWIPDEALQAKPEMYAEWLKDETAHAIKHNEPYPTIKWDWEHDKGIQNKSPVYSFDKHGRYVVTDYVEESDNGMKEDELSKREKELFKIYLRHKGDIADFDARQEVAAEITAPVYKEKDNVRYLFEVFIVDPELNEVVYEENIIGKKGEEAKLAAAVDANLVKDVTEYDFIVRTIGEVRPAKD